MGNRRNPVDKNHPLYMAWCSMKARCDNPNIKYSRLYKDIEYDKGWKNFANFYADMHDGWEKGLTLDRKNNLKGYSKKNCRWATPKEQANNTRRNRWFTIDGVTKTFAQWKELSGVKRSTVDQRYYVYGWSLNESLGFTPRKIIGK